MNDARLLIVGREDGIVRGWVDHLREAGGNISVVPDGTGALRHLSLLEPDIILIDVRLAGPIDGFDTCRAIRSRSSAVVVLAASRSDAYDEVVALAVGADHYVPEDTPIEVLVARLRSLVRRARGTLVPDAVLGDGDGPAPRVGGAPALARAATNGHNGSRPSAAVHAGVGARNGQSGHRGVAQPMRLMDGLGAVGGLDDGPERIVEGDLEIDLVAREVHVAGSPASLTRIEFDLLVTLARQPRRVFTREQLMASAWDEPFDGSHVLDTHLSRLRGKITEAGGERVAHAVRGVGYRLRG